MQNDPAGCQLVNQKADKGSITPDEQVGALHGFLCHLRIGEYNALKAPWRKMLYKCAIYI